jgi:hypothetical protein
VRVEEWNHGLTPYYQTSCDTDLPDIVPDEVLLGPALTVAAIPLVAWRSAGTLIHMISDRAANSKPDDCSGRFLTGSPPAGNHNISGSACR